MIDRAKLRIPNVPAQTLARDRVTRALEDLRDAPLLMVCAPAGSGKTTAVINWAHARGVPTAWLSLDRLDNDPVRLARHVAEALGEARRAPRGPTPRALGPSADAIGAYLPLIVERLAGARPPGMALVLDDYHLVEDPAAHALVEAIVDALPAGATVVLVSRTRPPLAAATPDVAVVDESTLRFTREESGHLLNGRFGLDLADERLAEVDRALHGWPAGLSLLGWSTQDGDGAVPGVLAALAAGEVADYLEEEVLGGLAPAEQTRILETSILDRLLPDLCAAVLDGGASDPSAAGLPVAGLFTVVDDEGWARTHDLVRDGFRSLLARRAPDRLPILHARAADWFERHGHPEQALEHALRAGEAARCARLILEHHEQWLGTGETRFLRRALTLMADPGPDDAARIAVVDLSLQGYEGKDMRLLVPEARRLIERHADDAWVLAALGLIATNQFGGDVRAAIALGRTMRERSPQLREHAMLNMAIAGSMWAAGELDEALTEVAPYLAPEWPPAIRVPAHGIASRVWVDRGNAARATALTTQAVEVMTREGLERVSLFNSVWVSHGDALLLAGELEQARRYLDFGLELEGSRAGTIGVGRTLISHAQLALAEGDPDAARRHARRARRILETYPDAGAQLYERLSTVEQGISARTSAGLHGSPITPAERRVLALLDSDLSWAEIADELYLSRNTVKSHVRRIYGRLGVTTRAEAVRASRDGAGRDATP